MIYWWHPRLPGVFTAVCWLAARVRPCVPTPWPPAPRCSHAGAGPGGRAGPAAGGVRHGRTHRAGLAVLGPGAGCPGGWGPGRLPRGAGPPGRPCARAVGRAAAAARMHVAERGAAAGPPRGGGCPAARVHAGGWGVGQEGGQAARRGLPAQTGAAGALLHAATPWRRRWTARWAKRWRGSPGCPKVCPCAFFIVRAPPAYPLAPAQTAASRPTSLARRPTPIPRQAPEPPQPATSQTRPARSSSASLRPSPHPTCVPPCKRATAPPRGPAALPRLGPPSRSSCAPPSRAWGRGRATSWTSRGGMEEGMRMSSRPQGGGPRPGGCRTTCVRTPPPWPPSAAGPRRLRTPACSASCTAGR
jgi:hypothetical protein